MSVPLFVQRLFGSVTWRMQTDTPVLFLTFDDGPNPDITPRVLDVLKKFQAKATFFCVGENVQQFPGIYQRIIADGHTIGNHTFHHLNGWKTKTNRYLQDVDACEAVLNSENRTGGKENPGLSLFRPPYGKLNPAQYNRLKSTYSIVMWDVLSRDFDHSLSATQCFRNVRDHARSGSIVVYHDSNKAKERVLPGLPHVLDYFSGKNFSFDCLPVHSPGKIKS